MSSLSFSFRMMALSRVIYSSLRKTTVSLGLRFITILTHCSALISSSSTTLWLVVSF